MHFVSENNQPLIFLLLILTSCLVVAHAVKIALPLKKFINHATGHPLVFGPHYGTRGMNIFFQIRLNMRF